jgi:hypothetical protein
MTEKKKMTQGWVVYGGMRHAEPQREMFSRSYDRVLQLYFNSITLFQFYNLIPILCSALSSFMTHRCTSLEGKKHCLIFRAASYI